jgi:hypothetical protein
MLEAMSNFHPSLYSRVQQEHRLTKLNDAEAYAVRRRADAYYVTAERSGRQWFDRAQQEADQQEAKRLASGPGLPPLLPELKRGCAILAGGRGSGKSHLMKHMVADRKQWSKVMIIDPHTPGHVCGIGSLGGRRNYPLIAEILQSILTLGDQRFKDPSLDRTPYSIFVDEWRLIMRNIKGAGDILGTIAAEFRAVKIDLIIASQTATVKGLGIEGDGELRECFTICKLKGYEGEDHEAWIEPPPLSAPTGHKPEKAREFALPPLWVEDRGQPIAAGDLVIDLPVQEQEPGETWPGYDDVVRQMRADPDPKVNSYRAIAKACGKTSGGPTNKDIRTICGIK